MPPSPLHLFEAPPSHLEAGDRTYRRWLLQRGPRRYEEPFGWEESDREHSGPLGTYIQARAAFNRLRDAYARQLGVGTGGQVHHAIELQVLKRFPGVFTPLELNNIANLRGIPGEVDPLLFERRKSALLADMQRRGIQQGTPVWNDAVRAFSAGLLATGMKKKTFHNGAIRRYWNEKYDQLRQQLKDEKIRRGTDQYRSFVRRFLTNGVKGLDSVTGGLYSEHRKQQTFTPYVPPPPRPRPPRRAPGSRIRTR